MVFFLFFYAGNVMASEAAEVDQIEEKPVLYYFWGYCPLCPEPEEHLENIKAYPVEIQEYEVVYSKEGRQVYDEIREELGIDTIVFPTIIFEDQYWFGYDQSIEQEIIDAVEYTLYEKPKKDEVVYTVPVIGEVNLQEMPILGSTIIISFLDGFNPCSFFVLTFLLAIIVHSASRKRVLLVGITFLLITTAVYGLFIAGALSVMLFAEQLFLIRNIVAAIVIVMGVMAIKDFFTYREGFSLSIPESYKSRYYKQVRNVFYTKSVFPMVSATALMALGISLVELPCTAGFPFIWSSLVAGLDLSTPGYMFLLFVYLATYLSVEFVIFIIAVVRMRAMKLTEERGRLLKLIAGSLMLVLGMVLLFRPQYMESMVGIMVALGATILVVLLMYLIRKIVGVVTSQ